ncbi:MAG: hypothetical protein P0116_16525 [Candidatus Nitrosocosmicus sp.]|nr:hypothetical protein [Candidatus Nitrosocosmicus sp.]
MDSDISKNITLLANKIVNILIEKSNGDYRSPIAFPYVYEPSNSINASLSNCKSDKSNLQIRQSVVEHLLENELILSCPENMKVVYVTQKALDQYPL